MTAQELRERLWLQPFFFDCLMLADRWRAELSEGLTEAKPLVVLNFGEAIAVVGEDALKAFDFGMVKHLIRITRHATPGAQVFQVAEWSHWPDPDETAHICWEIGGKEAAMMADYLPVTIDATEESWAK